MMVRGCFPASGIWKPELIETDMNALGYVDILKRNVAASVAKLGLPSGWIFQQDSDPKHSSRLAKEWLL